MNNPNHVSFVLDGKTVNLNFADSKYKPTTTLLQYLRDLPGHKSVKEGCAEGDCGACTVVMGELKNDKIQYRAYDSCLIFLPAVHGKQIITAENLGNSENLHPVQQAMHDYDGSQCGFCTPGFVMSIFALYKQEEKPDKEEITNALSGNLCRCTGYRPIIEAAESSIKNRHEDHFCKCEDIIASLLKKINTKDTIEIITEKQKYFIPFTKKEALSLRKQFPNALLIAGSTDIALRVTKRHEFLPEIIDLSHIRELDCFNINKDKAFIGSNYSLEDLRNSSKSVFPALNNILNIFGSRQIRNRACLGGNIGSASPIGDSIPVLMAYDAEVVLESVETKRTIKLREFITGYRQTQCKPSEIITEIIVPIPKSDILIKSYKVSKRKDLDISTVSACFSLKLNENKVEDIAIFYGGMSAFTKRAVKTEEILKGKTWNRKNIEIAMKYITEDYKPISDARAGFKVREIMAANLLMKFWVETNQVYKH
ncbi:MAG TPA: xanthine dehydrogenase small subunit [Bacteroidales bacterium]|nr:xanthine dehydrogenase small subunit [Bacteroidales bacterium]